MAESQLECMEDGRIVASIPESRPEFYYSEVHRAALEELLRNGDDAFKKRLRDNDARDFLSPREIDAIRSTAERYDAHEDDDAGARRKGADDSTSMRSTYWPQMSDTDLPLLDMGWPNTGFFKGVTRVIVHMHPPKDNGPHLKEVVRRLIQEAHKVIAIVMDLLTDLQILQDLLDAASKRSVAVYIILDGNGAPQFLNMCKRLEVSPQHLQNIRTRMLRGVGLDLSYGRIPGCLSNKYMIIDGDKVMFGSYSFSWSSSRMDRNIITIMSGQIVEMFDRDFRELYAMSRELNLFKEFSLGKRSTAASTRMTVPTRPVITATSRFQVSLGDKGNLKVPAHKYHNPKYLLALGNLPNDISTAQDLIDKMEESRQRFAAEGNPIEVDNNEPLDSPTPTPSVNSKKGSSLSCVPSKKKRFSLLRKSKQKGAKEEKADEGDPGPSTTTNPTPPTTSGTTEDITEEPSAETSTSKKTKSKKKSKKKSSEEQGTENDKGTKKGCVIF
ncbi:protein FAM83F-like [Silurus meridionalis]|uniref:Scaffolding anchor of CK1 domain-containing protein n=1 Tax=Silurus meridionalis TaxID=175797 RepID=A0A8T0BWD2_SILME|nr:protein FAM83F-like [Silurus meridionalis]KAF7711175.1 hypothetical protein HF521_000186 [Silurus meridionalis]KAI5108769.1 protein FAM83F [Silurus meridionalis]